MKTETLHAWELESLARKLKRKADAVTRAAGRLPGFADVQIRSSLLEEMRAFEKTLDEALAVTKATRPVEGGPR